MCQQVEKRFKAEMDNDLNIPGALSVIFDFLREINRLMDTKDVSKSNVNEIYSTMIRLDTVLGLLKTDDENISKKIKDLIDRREEARRSKDWKKSDQIRNELLENGIILEDTLEGVKWKKKI
jgi:cysteinyl-tRNA synthetase